MRADKFDLRSGGKSLGNSFALIVASLIPRALFSEEAGDAENLFSGGLMRAH